MYPRTITTDIINYHVNWRYVLKYECFVFFNDTIIELDLKRERQTLSSSLDAVLLAVGAHLGQVCAIGALLLHVLHDMRHRDNGLDRDTEIPLDLLDSRHVAVLARLLTINRYKNTGQLSLTVLDDLDRFPDGSTGSDDIVNHQNLALQS